MSSQTIEGLTRRGFIKGLHCRAATQRSLVAAIPTPCNSHSCSGIPQGRQAVAAFPVSELSVSQWRTASVQQFQVFARSPGVSSAPPCCPSQHVLLQGNVVSHSCCDLRLCSNQWQYGPQRLQQLSQPQEECMSFLLVANGTSHRS